MIHRSVGIFSDNGYLHNIEGPALIAYDSNDVIISTEWFVNNIKITDEVQIWLKENNITLPFDDNAKILFKLRFL